MIVIVKIRSGIPEVKLMAHPAAAIYDTCVCVLSKPKPRRFDGVGGEERDEGNFDRALPLYTCNFHGACNFAEISVGQRRSSEIRS